MRIIRDSFFVICLILFHSFILNLEVFSLPIPNLKIILKTFIKVFKKDGINQEGNATIRKFEGVKKEKINA